MGAKPKGKGNYKGIGEVVVGMLDTAIKIIKTKDVMTHQERALVLSVLEDYANQPEPEPQVVEVDGDVVIDYLLDAFVHRYAQICMDNE